MTVPMTRTDAAQLMEQVIIKGDLAKLTPEERNAYYMSVCQSLGLNPLTRPFDYITLNGKLTLYAKRDAADQLRKINGISIKILSQDIANGVLTVHVQAHDKSGRQDEDMGAVAFPPNITGEARANAILKCVTKGKRRVTLSISGLGFSDESEVDDVPVDRRPGPPAENVMRPADPPHDPKTGEIVEERDPSEILAEHDLRLGSAAQLGMAELEKAWKATPAEYQRILKAALDRRYKVIAVAVDNTPRDPLAVTEDA